MTETQNQLSAGGGSSKKYWAIAIIILVVVLGGWFLTRHYAKTPPASISSQQYKAIQSNGINADLLAGEPMQKLNIIYSGQASDGTMQTGVTFVANKSLAEIWSYYNGYFQNNNWTFAPGASTKTMPNPSSTDPVIFSVSNATEKVVVYATPNGPSQTTVKISAFVPKK